MSDEVNINDKTEGEPGENPNKRWEKWGALTRFGSGQEQPSSEAKKAGWQRRKKNRELAQYLLGLEFVGKSQAFKDKIGQYFGLTAEQMEGMTNEAVMMMKQIGMAIENGDMIAAKEIMDRAYGKPKEYIDLQDEDGNRPQLNITIIAGAADVPEINESENANENDLPTQTE